MRSIRLLTATVVILTGAWACGDDGGGNVGPNDDPVAAFTAPTTCTTSAPCAFADASTDPDGATDIVTRLWNFGDGGTSNEQNPSHQFLTAGTFSVSLTVTDAAGATGAVSHDVVVTGTTTNTPPTAAFSVPTCVVNVACLFGDLSSDTDGNITAWQWTFGDNGTAAEQNPSHTYVTAGTYSVGLTVTDDDGATGTITQSVTVSPAASQNCTTVGSVVTCELSITQASRVTLALTGSECELGGNNVSIAQPYGQAVFFNICSLVPGAPGTTKQLVDGTGAPLTVTGPLRVRFQQGTASAGSPIPGAPAAHLDGTYPNWTISIDDGGNPQGPDEPDFTDVIMTVTAAP